MNYDDPIEMENLRAEMAVLRENMKKRAEKIKTVYDPELSKQIKKLTKNTEKAFNLTSPYDVYALYRNENEGEEAIYGLIYTRHTEITLGSDITPEKFTKVVQSEATILHQQLVESKLPLDYFFIVPYFDYTDRQRDGFMSEAILTNRSFVDFDI
jgi:hypothetical protein